MRIGFWQFRPRFGAAAHNLRQAREALSGVAADLLVLPELAFTGYHFRDRAELMALAEDPAASPTVEGLSGLCRENGFHLVTGFAERKGDKVYNSALLIGPEGLVATYRKLHLFNTEKEFFDPGDLPLRVVEVAGARIGMMVCFDWAFPEVARTLTLRGAQVLCHPSNLVLSGYCQQAMLTRCLENRVYAVTANRFGADVRPHGTLRFTGRSQIVAPGGVLLVRAPAQRRRLEVVEIDPATADDKAITPRNDLLADRRPEFYA
ncbi:MAG: acyltransferase [Gammaproteobacteria bacterium]|nr:MAG: acyltransferase [Gammaproteobacteria bacterium]